MITCANCGKQFNEPISFCSRCGAPINDTMYATLDSDTDLDDILSLDDLEDIEKLVSGLSTQQIDAQLFEEKLREADTDGNGSINLEELFVFMSEIIDEENANMFCDHFAETKNFTENGEVPIEDVVQMWLGFDSFLKDASNPANFIVIKQILDAYKKERQFLDPTNILLDDELDDFSYRDSFNNMINSIDVNKDGKLTEEEVRDFLSTFIPANELNVKVSAFMEELNATHSTDEDSSEDLFVDINSISNAKRSLEILDIDSQISQEAKSEVDDLLDELNLPSFKDLSTDDIFSEFDEEEEEEIKPEPAQPEEIKPIFSRVRVKSEPTPEIETEVEPEKKDLSSFLDASDEELEALLNESGGDLDDMFGASSDTKQEFSVPKFSIDNIFDDFEETPVEELSNRLNNNFQYDDDDDDDDDNTQNSSDDDDDDDDSFDSQFITDDYSPDVYEESTDEDFSGLFEELLVSPDNFDDKVQKDELDEALEYIKNNSNEDVSEEVTARVNKDFELYEDVFEEAPKPTPARATSTAADAIFEDESSITDVTAMGADEFFTNEELTNALLDIKDLTQKKKEKSTETKPSLTSKIKSRLFVDVRTGTINTALIITLIITGCSVYYVQKKPYQNTFYTNYSKDVLNLYDQDTWDAYLSVVGYNDLFLMYANAYLNGELTKTEFLDIGNEYISHNTRASSTFLTNTYPESENYAYDLHLYTFKFTDLADNLVTAVKDDAPQSEVQAYLQSMESLETVDTNLLLERRQFLKDVGIYE